MRTYFCVFVLGVAVSAAAGQDQPNPARGRTRPASGATPGAPPAPVPAPQATGRSAVPGRRGIPVDPLSLPPRRTGAPPIDLSGAWTGVFTSNETVVAAELTLANTDELKRRVTGELQFKTLQSASPGPMGQQPTKEGSWKVEGMVDPGSGAVLLEQRGSAKQPAAAGIQPMSFAMVYAPELKEMAGQEEKLGGFGPLMIYCLFARDQHADALRALAEHASQAKSILTAGAGTPPSDDAIGQWAAKYDQEYPNSASQDPIDKTVFQSLPLFNDATFKPVFGESYDTMDYGQLALSMQRLGAPVTRTPVARTATPRMPRVPAGQTPEQQQQAMQQLQQQVQQQLAAQQAGRPDPNFVRNHMAAGYWLCPSSPRIVAVAAMRIIDAWQAQMLGHFQKDAPVATAFDDLAATQESVKTRVVYAWPSEKKSWENTFEQIRAATASPTLAANVSHMMTVPADMDAARLLAAWGAENAVLLKHVPAQDSDAAQLKVNAKLDEVLTALMAGPKRELATLGNGSSAIRGQVLWYYQFMPQWSFAAARPPVKEVLDDLMRRRDSALTAAKPDFLQVLASAKTLDAVNQLLKDNLSLPGDPKLAAYPEIARAVTARRGEIDTATLLALFSEREQKMMDKPGHVDLSKWDGKGPESDEVRLAMLRAYSGGKGHMIDAHKVRCETYAPNMIMMPFEFNITMDVEKVAECKPVPNSRDFDCTFEIHMVTEIPSDNTVGSIDPRILQGFQMASKMVNTVEENTKDERHEILRLTENGWQVPNLRDGMSILNGMGDALQATMRETH